MRAAAGRKETNHSMGKSERKKEIDRRRRRKVKRERLAKKAGIAAKAAKKD